MPDPILQAVYAAKPETNIYQSETSNRIVNRILLGTWAGIVEDHGGDRVRVITAGPDGWLERDDIRHDEGLKIFFVDVGQGDGMLVECCGKRLLIDAGPNSNLCRYLKRYQYKYLLNENQPIHIDTVLISHFDADHYKGLITLLNDEDFTFGSIYHNGIARFHKTRARRPHNYNTDLGRESNGVLRTSFNDLEDVRELLHEGGLQTTFRNLLNALENAHDSNRLERFRRLTVRNGSVPGYSLGDQFSIEILAPVPRRPNGAIDYPWFTDSSHTRNGHSLVLKLNYTDPNNRSKSILLGGDLNSESEHYLMQHYDQDNPFRVDVAKSCHHGSGDFSVDFMGLVRPFATVISSGDNESHAHPRADAIGCAGKYSRGRRPKVFSTELARSVSSSGDILYGMIHCRTDGDKCVMAQMKEVRTGVDVWDSYEI